MDASPNCILEAMATGLPILASDVGGVPELCSGCAKLVSNEPGTIGDEVVDLLSNPMATERMGASAHKMALEYFSWEKMADELARTV